MEGKTNLLTRDIERLENTSFATAFAGAGPQDEGPLDSVGVGYEDSFAACMFTHYSLVDCLAGSGDVCVWVQSECSCGCLGCDPEAVPPALQPYQGGVGEESRWLLDVIRRG